MFQVSNIDKKGCNVEIFQVQFSVGKYLKAAVIV